MRSLSAEMHTLIQCYHFDLFLCECVSVSVSVYVCVSKSNFCLFELKYCSYIFPDRADCSPRLNFCNAKDETRMKDGYSKQAIDSCKRQTIPAERVVYLSVSPAGGYQTTHESECRPTYKTRQLFLSKR